MKNKKKKLKGSRENTIICLNNCVFENQIVIIKNIFVNNFILKRFQIQYSQLLDSEL